MAEQVAKVLSLNERIAASRRARAVERAWLVAKSLEEGRPQLEGLRWVEPVRGERGISRRIDFGSEFPDVTVLKPTPVDIGVYAPAKRILVGEEGMEFAWTMPLLTRIRAAAELPAEIRTQLHVTGSPKVRPIIDIVSFLPMPRTDAPAEEQFKTEFYVGLNLGSAPGTDKHFCAVVKYGGKIIDQFATTGSDIVVLADPRNSTLFSAEMLASLSATELAATPESAGTMDIFIYRVRNAFDIAKMFADSALGAGSQNVLPFSGSDSGRPKGLDFGGSLTRGGSSGSLGLGVIPGGGRSSLPSPAAAPKEVGDVRLGEGTKGEAATFETFSALFDPDFAIQQISIRFLGVREGSREATIRAIEQLASS